MLFWFDRQCFHRHGPIVSLGLLLLGIHGSIAAASECSTTSLSLWVGNASIPSLREEALANWNGSDPCTWTGVSCDGGCFEELNLTNLGLSVFEDPTCNAFSLVCDLFSDPRDETWAPCFGQGSQECFAAAKGEYINGYALRDVPFKKLLLGGNTLIGTWPSIPAFDSLIALDLSNHLLESDFHLLATREDVEPYESLRSYKCDGCNLVGTIPNNLDFELKGVWAQRYPSLQELSLSGSKMVGNLPEGWGKWSSLRVLDLSNNNLSGSIPESWGDLTGIELVDLSGNDQLSSEIPQNWAKKMTCAEDKPLRCEEKKEGTLGSIDSITRKSDVRNESSTPIVLLAIQFGLFQAALLIVSDFYTLFF